MHSNGVHFRLVLSLCLSKVFLHPVHNSVDEENLKHFLSLILINNSAIEVSSVFFFFFKIYLIYYLFNVFKNMKL